MPITARLSRRFYDKFGDEIVDELVEWLNQVDLAFRTELQRQNESLYARFESRLEQRLAEFGAQLRAELRAEMHAMRADLMKWAFVFWATTLAAVLLK